MLYADGRRSRTSGSAHDDHIREAEQIASEAEIAGDHEMARILRIRAALVRRGLWDYPRTHHMKRADGSTFPLLAARDHIRRRA